ncbi:MAG: hypothetical protein AAFR35_03140 [Pseudomonadota bacterium]
MRRTIYIVFALVFVVGLTPGLGMVWSGWIAERHDCNLSESNVTPCLVWGRNIGPALHAWFVTGWLSLLTLPAAAFAGFALLVMGIGDLIRRRG